VTGSVVTGVVVVVAAVDVSVVVSSSAADGARAPTAKPNAPRTTAAEA
jgi:hypothetical protein